MYPAIAPIILDTGSVKMRRITNVRNNTLMKRETEYRQQVATEDTGQSQGGVDLF